MVDADHRPGVRHRRDDGHVARAGQRAGRGRRARRSAVRARRRRRPRPRGRARLHRGHDPSRADLESRYPRAIPIGIVKRIDLGDGDLDKRIHVQPAADLKRMDLVQVLTEPARRPGGRRMTVTSAAVIRLGAARPARRDPPAQRRLADHGLRRLGRPDAAAGGLGRVPRAARSPAPSSASASACSSTSACCQTLGVSSLALVAVGYGAGRIRELRDPAHTASRRSPSAPPRPFVAAVDLHAAAVPARRAGAGLAAAACVRSC